MYNEIMLIMTYYFIPCIAMKFWYPRFFFYDLNFNLSQSSTLLQNPISCRWLLYVKSLPLIGRPSRTCCRHLATGPVLALCLMMLIGSLLILAGDVELNPGPRYMSKIEILSTVFMRIHANLFLSSRDCNNNIILDTLFISQYSQIHVIRFYLILHLRTLFTLWRLH